MKIEERTEILLLVNFLNQVFWDYSNKIYPERLKNRSIESILNLKIRQEKSFYWKKLFLLQISVPERAKRGKTLFLKIKWERGTIN